MTYIHRPIKKTVCGVKDQVVSFFKTQNYSKPKHVKTVSRNGKKPNKLRIKKQYEKGNIIKNKRYLLKLKKEN